jgi:hypothetical protein
MNPELGEKVLGLVLNKPKNISIFNKHILKLASTPEQYKHILYNICFQLKSRDHREVFEDLKNGRVGWEDPIYQQYKISQAEKDDFLNNPFQVEEGVNTCQKCGSKKTYSYTKQLRCADEGTTVFCICVVCSHRWRFG